MSDGVKVPTTVASKHWHCPSCGLSFDVGEHHEQIRDFQNRIVGCMPTPHYSQASSAGAER